MALPGFSINDLIDAAVQVKVVYDAFFHKYTNSATQMHDLIYEIHRFAQNLERSRDSFERVGVDDYDFRSIYNTLTRCQEFLEENKSILSNKKSPEALWRTARLPFSKEYIHLKSALQAHRGELTDRSVQYLVHNTTTPNNGLTEPKAEEVVATDQRRGTVAGTSYPASPTFGGLQIPNLPTDSTIINHKYQYVTTPVSPSSRSLERAGFYHDSQTLSPPRPPSSFGPSPQNSPELSATDTIRSSISPRSSPVPPPSSRLSSVASPPPPCPELILPQPALGYVVAEILFGSKKIELKRKPAGRPSTSPTSPGRELVIINEKNEERVKHRIKLGPTQRCYPYTWNSGNHPALEVTFKGIPEGNHTLHFKGKPVDLESNIPRYVFSNINDFTDFQSEVRNKLFLGAFAINKISSEKSGKFGDATNQHLKIWRDKETRQCSLSFYGSSLKRARDLEFPFKYIKKEPEPTKRSEELILRFDPLSWSQLLASSPSVSRGHNKAPSESEYTTSRHNTFSTVSTDRTASTATSFFNFSRQPTAGSVATAATSVATITSSSRAPSFGSQNSDSGHSVTSDRPTTTPLEDLTRKMKFLKITFPDAQEASRFHTAYKTALADTPSLPIDFQRVDWRSSPHPHMRGPSLSAPAAANSNWGSVSGGSRPPSTKEEVYATPTELDGRREVAEMVAGDGRFPVEMPGGTGRFPVEMSGTNSYPVEIAGGDGKYAVEMSGTNKYPVEMGAGDGRFPVEMMGEGRGYSGGRYSAELGGTPEESPDFW